MRFLPIAVALLGTVLIQPVKADPYAWCAVYGGTQGRESCYYITFEACLAEIRGLGGFCNQNPGYTGAAVSRDQRRPRPARR